MLQGGQNWNFRIPGNVWEVEHRMWMCIRLYGTSLRNTVMSQVSQPQDIKCVGFKNSILLRRGFKFRLFSMPFIFRCVFDMLFARDAYLIRLK